MGAFRAADGGAGAVLTIGSGIFARNADLLNELELGSRLPTLYPENSGETGTIQYSANFRDLVRRAASDADLILKGATPGG